MATDPDVRLADAVEGFIEAQRRGEAVTVETWLTAHPECGPELRELLGAVMATDDAIGQVPVVPERIGDVRIVRELGRGGMGVVYEGVQLALERPVAVKVIARAVIGDRTRDRFLREARLAASLDHPHIVPVFTVGTHADAPYLVMGLVRGGPATRFLSDTAKAEPLALRRQRALALMIPACRAVAHAHARGILHRDLKPGNLLVGEDGVVKVADFGLAISSEDDSLTSTDGIIGTLRYLAPERFDGPGDARADIYALGLTLLELASGKPVFDGLSRSALVRAIVIDGLADPRRHDEGIDPALAAVIRRATARDPARRHATAEALAEDLAALERGETPVAARRPWGWVVAIAMSLVVLGLVVAWFLRPPPPRPDLPRPESQPTAQPHPPWERRPADPLGLGPPGPAPRGPWPPPPPGAP